MFIINTKQTDRWKVENITNKDVWKEHMPHDHRLAYLNKIATIGSHGFGGLYEYKSGIQAYTYYALEYPSVSHMSQNDMMEFFFLELRDIFTQRSIDFKSYLKLKKFSFFLSNDNLIIITVE